MNPQSNAFLKIARHPVTFRMFLFSKLPSAFFSGVRIRKIESGSATVSVPFKWFSQNPFRSTYFACLAMAAEMSTGVLAQMHVYKRKPAVSMLVLKMEAQYFKKATGLTRFTCEDGLSIANTIEQAVTTGEAQTITARSSGVNESGESIATFLITWSFKSKTKL